MDDLEYSLSIAAAVGTLEVVKYQLIQEAINPEEESDDEELTGLPYRCFKVVLTGI